jgi:hypothetical protein
MATPAPDTQRGPSGTDAPLPNLGPYETAYDVRRGYDQPGGPPPGPAPRERPAPVWIGRRGER